MAVRRTLPRVGFFISPLTSRFPSALEISLGKFHCPWEISRFLGMWNPIHPDSRQCTYTISEWPTTRYNDERLVIHMSGLRGWPDNKTINVPSAKHWKKMCQSMPPPPPLPPIPQCQQQLNIWLWICCECKRTRSQIDLHSCSAECDLEGLSTTKVCCQIEIELFNTAIWVDKIKTTTYLPRWKILTQQTFGGNPFGEEEVNTRLKHKHVFLCRLNITSDCDE